VAGIIVNCLLVLSLILGIAPANGGALQEQSEGSADTGNPFEQEEAAARSGTARAALKRGAERLLLDVTGRLIAFTVTTKSDSSPPLPFGYPTNSPPHRHRLYGVFRI